MSVTRMSAEDAEFGRNDLHGPDGPAREERRRLARRQRRRSRVTAALVVVVLAGGAGGIYVFANPLRHHAAAATTSTAVATGLAQVTRGSLSARSTQNGTLSFAGDYTIVNKADGSYTKLPKVGDVIAVGKVLYWVNGKPVILLSGAAPVYRALAQNDEGDDVKQLNTALVALGYATRSKLDPASTKFGLQTYYALKKLQKAVGLDQTGQLPLGQVVFVPANAIRITKVTGVEGASAGPNQTALEASSTERQVKVDIRASQQTTVEVGDEVTISLPNGRSTPGVVSSVGKVAAKDSEGNVTVEVLIRPGRPQETGQLDQAPVQVSIVVETVKDVLSVPVNALLAMAGSGYAVEVVGPDGAHRLVRVETGLFDNSAGRVQVTGDGLTAGQNVVVPAS
jgi:peptidoglycan hydrolase-like protein with peptidoglycan-binding domain